MAFNHAAYNVIKYVANSSTSKSRERVCKLAPTSNLLPHADIASATVQLLCFLEGGSLAKNDSKLIPAFSLVGVR